VYELLGPDGTFALPNRRLRVTYDTSQHMRDLNDHTNPTSAGIYGHDYVMYDHGLFAAGIAHTIAPDASLHLVQVLNDWGVGTLETIVRGLELLAVEGSGRPLVVNLSLMLDIPQSQYLDHRPLPRQFDDWRWFRDWLGARPRFVERSHLPLRRVCEALQNRGVLVVAAAGNDGYKAVRPPARMPAALDTVVGVGALQKNSDQPASYSNISDGEGIGIATFGGSQDSSGTADAGSGILGVYIGPLPGATDPNYTGWAWWAGTSFAAPIVTAALALLRAAGKSPAEALDALYASVAEVPGAVEHIFHVTQG
jgi:subtilisin family serine protease